MFVSWETGQSPAVKVNFTTDPNAWSSNLGTLVLGAKYRCVNSLRKLCTVSGINLHLSSLGFNIFDMKNVNTSILILFISTHNQPKLIWTCYSKPRIFFIVFPLWIINIYVYAFNYLASVLIYFRSKQNAWSHFILLSDVSPTSQYMTIKMF
jgi:hypothetical protein